MKYRIYIIRNKITQSLYVGQTKQPLSRRYAQHLHACRSGSRLPLYQAMRKYGLENFDIVEIGYSNTKRDCNQMERDVILKLRLDKIKLYNITDGGDGGNTVAEENKEAWKRKISLARQGKKPALGMKHTKENKELFKEVSLKYWSTQETYDQKEVLTYRFCDANRLFGISKTHYYRLLRVYGRILSEEDEILADKHRVKP